MTSTSSREKIVIGILGEGGSGKDTVANIFSESGYSHVSASDIVREEIASRGLQTSRELQTSIGNEMRFRMGDGYWVDQSVLRAPSNAGRIAISGLYAPGEGAHIITAYGGLLISVIGPATNDLKVRYDRSQSRSDGSRDSMSYEDFVKAHERENSGQSSAETNLGILRSMAHYTISNVADLNFLRAQTLDIIDQIGAIS